jgi:hypothetical protein
MFESIELPPPEAIADLDDFGLLDTMELATTLETVAIDVQVAVIRELCRRQVRPAAGTGPMPSARALTSSPRRRQRKARKRRRRRH